MALQRALAQPLRRLACPASSSAGASSGSSGSSAWVRNSSGSAGKRPAELTDEELKELPGMLFTTANLIWSTTLAVGVAAGGLLGMFYLGSFIVGAAKSLRHIEEPPPPPPPPPPQKSLAELIAERKAELEAQLRELEELPRTPEVREAIKAACAELGRPAAWWRWW